MAPESSLGGYFLYLLEIFLPGIGFGELFRLWSKEESLFDRLGLALGLGLSIDTLVLMLRTSGVAHLSGIDSYTLYGIILAGAIALSVSIVIRRPKFKLPGITRADIVLLALLLVQSLMLVIYFVKYPIFPEYQSPDYAIHVETAKGLISGSLTSIPSGILYYGIHYQLASGIIFVGGEPLITARQTMAILVILSSLLFYSATKKIFSSSRVALIATGIYVLSGTIWFASVFDSGLFANFYGILAALFLLIALLGVINNFRAPSAWAIFLVAVVNAYFSHYTLLTLIPAIVLLPALQLLSVKKWDRTLVSYLVPALAVILPAVVPLIVFPNLGARILRLASSGGGVLSGSTYLSNFFAPIPVLSYLALEIFDDYSFLIMFVLTILYLYKVLRSRNPVFLIPIIWFLSLMIAAPVDTSAWRFSYEAIVPLVLMASFGLYAILPDSARQGKGRSSMVQRTRSSQRGSMLPRAFIFIVLLGGIIVGSWGTSSVSDSLSQTSVAAQSQRSVYNAIYWLGRNTPNDSQYFSVSDWRFTYTNLIIGRPTFYEYVRLPSNASEIARDDSADYIIVTKVTTLSLYPIPALFPWNNFPTNSSGNLSLVYQNPDVRIFEIENVT